MRKKLLLFLIFTIFIISLPANALATDKNVTFATKNENVPFSMEDVTVDFSPDGYMPKAECEDESIIPLIYYFAIDTESSSPVSLPITEAGKYQIFASLDKDGENFQISSFVTINPVEAKIQVSYKTVAYSRMENPVSYKIEPSWAEEFLDIKIDYYPIESLDSPPEEAIDAPIKLGLYYTVFNVSSKKSGVVCENKYMVYEIAAYRGKKLSESESTLSVPDSFKCTFQNLTTTYEKDKQVSVQYTLSPFAISGKVLYKRAYGNGTFSPYVEEAPSAPGEYVCEYFLGNTSIGSGTIFIDKKEVSITIENEVLEFTQKGIAPTAKCETENVEIAFTAFAIDEDGNVTMEEVPIPIKQCGKFSIIAYPKDTDYFKRTYSYGTIEITPATPTISITRTDFSYDGNAKNIGFTVSPENLKSSVEYYEWEDIESEIPLGSPPTRAGKYVAVISVYDDNGNYTATTKTTIMYIDDTSGNNSFSKFETTLLITLGALLTGVFAVCVMHVIKKVNEKKTKI